MNIITRRLNTAQELLKLPKKCRFDPDPPKVVEADKEETKSKILLGLHYVSKYGRVVLACVICFAAVAIAFLALIDNPFINTIQKHSNVDICYGTTRCQIQRSTDQQYTRGYNSNIDSIQIIRLKVAGL